MAHHLGQPVQRNRFRHPVAKPVAQIVWAHITQARLGRILLDQVPERAFGERERHDAGLSVTDGYYEEFAPHARYGPVVGRGWIEQGGGLLAADAPLLCFRLMEMFDAARLGALVTEYLGEPALTSVHKTTLRKAEPTVAGAWHQEHGIKPYCSRGSGERDQRQDDEKCCH